MVESEKRETEIVAFSSGKGGTGKTLMALCLGYALISAGHDVLMLDADTATDGLSLFMLGPDGMDALGDFKPPSTFRWILNNYKGSQKSGDPGVQFSPHEINRKHDHEIIYQALISGKGIYGDIEADTDNSGLQQPDNDSFREAVLALFETFRFEGEFDYVLVDTRGGFSFESTTLCALADSFIIVTEADYTNFYQDRNLVKRINKIAQKWERQPLLRGIIVNKATDGEEISFRLELEKEFPIKVNDTFPVPLDIQVIEAYRHQQMPYVKAQGSEFSSTSLRAFSRIMHLVTGRWEEDRIDKWNALVKKISTPYRIKYSRRILTKKWLKAWAVSIIVIAALVIAFSSYSYYQRFQERKWEDYSAAVFLTENPPSQRINYLILLYENGRKTFNGVDISRLDLSRLALSSIELQRGNLTQTVLKQTDLRGANLREADLTRANLKEANLQGTDLTGANFREANLQGANLAKANLRDANLKNADFQGADLESVLNLTLEQLSEVKTLYEAKLHPELLRQMEKAYPRILEKTMPDANQKTKK